MTLRYTSRQTVKPWLETVHGPEIAIAGINPASQHLLLFTMDSRTKSRCPLDGKECYQCIVSALVRIHQMHGQHFRKHGTVRKLNIFTCEICAQYHIGGAAKNRKNSNPRLRTRPA